MKKRLRLLCIILAVLFVSCASMTEETYEYAYLYEGLPFEMPKVYKPSFPDNKVCLSDFGGNPDGNTLNTEAFANAMQELSNKGGAH